MTYAYIEKPLHDYYRAHYPRLHAVCITEAQNRMLGGGLPVIPYGIDVERIPFVTDARGLPDHGRPARAAQGRRPRHRDRRARGAAARHRRRRDAVPRRERAVLRGAGPRRTWTAERSSTIPTLPNAEVARAHGPRPRLPLPDLLGRALRPRRRRGHGRRHPRRSRTPRGSLPELVEHGVTGFLGETDEELAGIRPRASAEIDRAACRRRAEERYSAERMVSDYEALYRRLAAR